MSDRQVPEHEGPATQRAEVDAAIDSMIRVVNAAVPRMVEAASLEGARRHAAAALLRRALELLEAVRTADRTTGAGPVVELGLRSIFEITCRARFLLACDEAEDEFVRMCHDHSARERKLA